MALDMNMTLDLLQFKGLASNMVIVSFRKYPSAIFVFDIVTFVGLRHSVVIQGTSGPFVFRSLLSHSQGINIKKNLLYFEQVYHVL